MRRNCSKVTINAQLLDHWQQCARVWLHEIAVHIFLTLKMKWCFCSWPLFEMECFLSTIMCQDCLRPCSSISNSNYLQIGHMRSHMPYYSINNVPINILYHWIIFNFQFMVLIQGQLQKKLQNHSTGSHCTAIISRH